MDETRLRNRLRGLLDLAWPEFDIQFQGLVKETPRALLALWPLPSDLAKVNHRTLRRVVRGISRGKVSAANTDRLRQNAKESIGVRAGADARRAVIRRLLLRWDQVLEQRHEIDEALAALVASNGSTRALLTIPEVSVVTAATLGGELGASAPFVSPRQVYKFAGLNLTRLQSGTSVLSTVRISRRGRVVLRRQLFLLAGRWCQSRGLFREQYLAMLKRNGGARQKAVCALARKLVPLVLHVMRTGERFDPTRWRADRRVGSSASLSA